MKTRTVVIIAALIAATSAEVGAQTDAKVLVRDAAIRHGIPVDFALRVAKVETGVRCNVVGAAGERGPLQILPATARGLGFRNVRSASCETQTDAGMTHLARCYRGMSGNWKKAAACHNQGLGVLSGHRIRTAAMRYAEKVVD